MPRKHLPVVVFFSSLALSLAAAWIVHDTGHERDTARFINAINSTEARLDSRIRSYVTVLRGTSGLFASSGDVTLDEFRIYIRQFDLPRSFKGVQGIGFSKRIAPGSIDSLHRVIRASGIAEYTVHPDSLRDEYFPIVYLEPQDERNRVALGYDMFTDATRRQAMAAARDSGRVTATGAVRLVQEIDDQEQAGFLIYLPVYRGQIRPTTVAQRRELLLGFVYAPFRMGDMFTGVFGDTPPLVAFRVYDGAGVDPARLAYDSSVDTLSRRTPAFQLQRVLTIFGREWTIVFSSLPVVEERSGRMLAPAIAVAGLLVSLLLAGLTRREVQAGLRAESSEKVRGRFFAAMSHELRTPLNAIIGYNDLLLLGIHGPLTAPQQQGIERSQWAARHLLELVNDVLDISKIEAGKISIVAGDVEMDELITELFSTFQATAEQHGCTLHLQSEPGTPQIVSDPRRVRQIILNLLSNAIRFGRGQPIHVHCSGTASGGVVVDVRDGGPGIALEDQERIFEEFVQLPSVVQGGTGLGLPISRRLAQLLNGTLTLRSAPGQGSTFSLTLPPRLTVTT